jgi:hypothetical protein
VFLQDGQGIGHADLFQKVERRFVNAFHIPVGERFIAATRNAGTDDGRTASRPPGPAALPAPGAVYR